MLINKRKLLLGIKEYATPIRIIGGILLVIALICGIFWLIGYKSADAAAYIIQLLSSLLLAAPTIADYFLGIKPIREMSFEEILNFIETSSSKNDWYTISRSDITECFLKIDPRLRFRMKYTEDGVQNEHFIEPWANKHPDPNATGYWCDLIYNGDFLKRFTLVYVDGGRAALPLPNINTTVISKYNYHIAKIFDASNTLDEYIQRSGLSVSEY